MSLKRFRFIWMMHAEDRLSERGLTRAVVEQAIRNGHWTRGANRGAADWRVDTAKFVVVYDHSESPDAETVCVVSVWSKRRQHLVKYK